MANERLRERAWEAMRPRYRARLAALCDAYASAKPDDLATDDVAKAATAAVESRVATLLIEAERMIPGQIDLATGKVQFGDPDRPDTDDVLDDLGEQVLRTGGDVVVVPKDEMPSSTGVAATFRF
jgi:hypothetical protein